MALTAGRGVSLADGREGIFAFFRDLRNYTYRGHCGMEILSYVFLKNVYKTAFL